jgi:predicted amidophosphoribosyltransferase
MAAKKKTPAAKKTPAKRKAPSRPCVKCGKPVHPRAKKCPECGADQPQSTKAKAAAKKPRKAKAAVKATKVTVDPWKRMVALKKDIDSTEAKLAAMKLEFSKLAGTL